MPLRPPKQCAKYGCPVLTNETYCAKHRAEYLARVSKEYERERATATQRGYGALHRKWRRIILNRDPVCKICGRAPSTEADHIDGNNRNLSLENGQGLCKTCHSKKTVKEQGRWKKKVIADSS